MMMKMMTHSYYILLLQVVFIGYISGCSLVPGTKLETFTLEQTLDKAPIVVSGKDVFHMPQTDEVFYRNYTFDVYCVFKSDNKSVEIPSTIFLLEVGAISCDGSRMDEGKQYIAGLKRASKTDLDNIRISSDVNISDVVAGNEHLYFVMAEPGTLATAAFDATEANLNATANICGIDDVIKSYDHGGSASHSCPVPADECIQVSHANRLMSYGLCILLVVITMFFH